MKSNYTLYGCRRSGSLIVEMVLAEIGLEYDLVEVNLETDAQCDEAYASINPQRKLPTLITPTGETLTESAAIVLTLEERYPESGLLPPRKSPERAKALRILMFVATELYPIIEINDSVIVFKPTAWKWKLGAALSGILTMFMLASLNPMFFPLGVCFVVCFL